MVLTLLPCEIFHREFDAKLLIASEIASVYGAPVLIGYDKYFNQLIPHLPSSTLLEKSCSTIMWNGRIRPIKERNGSVLVSDEEGFNNLAKANKHMFMNRVDQCAAQSIDIYGCWGDLDYQFWRGNPALTQKLIVMGNSRSDLLGSIGRRYFSKDMYGLNSIFGRFVLVSDNFCIERRGGMYSMPKFNVTQLEQAAAENEFEQRIKSQVRRREFFAELLDDAAKNLSELQFIVRPHPMADSRWWSNRFASHRNLHVIYHKSVDPWILSACSLVSMGCTTALQASVANIPVIEIEDPDLEMDKSQNLGYSHLFTDLFVKSSDQLQATILNAYNGVYSLSGSKKDLLSKYCHGCNSSLTYKLFAEKLCSLSPQSITDLSCKDVLDKAYKFYAKNPLYVDDTKWPPVSFSEIKSKFLAWQELLRPSHSLVLRKVAKYLYLIERK